MKILSIDYGKHKIGLASSEGELVSGFGSIRVNSLDSAVKQISEIIKKEKVEKVIIGLAESGESRKLAENFVGEMKKTGVDIEGVDETLTTHQAKIEVHELGGGDEDERAAMLILERYLEDA